MSPFERPRINTLFQLEPLFNVLQRLESEVAFKLFSFLEWLKDDRFLVAPVDLLANCLPHFQIN